MTDEIQSTTLAQSVGMREALEKALGALTDLARPICSVFNRSTKKYEFEDEHIAKALPGTFEVIQQIRAALAAQPPAAPVETEPTKEDFAKWSRVWHDTCETILTLLELPGHGSPQEMLAQVQAYVGAKPLSRSSAGNESAAVADQIIGQIEERFPDWRSYRDLIDCIDCTLHRLREDVRHDLTRDEPQAAQVPGISNLLEDIERIAGFPISGTSLQNKAQRFDLIRAKARAALALPRPQSRSAE